MNSNRVLKWNAIFPFLELAQPGYDTVLALQTIQFLFSLFFLDLLVCVCLHVHMHRRSYIHSCSGVWVHVRFGCQPFLSTVRLLSFTGLCHRVTRPSGLQASPASTSRFTIAALGWRTCTNMSGFVCACVQVHAFRIFYLILFSNPLA